MEPARLLAVRYLNTLPLIEGLDELPGIELETTVPARIADAVARGEADLGLASLVDSVRTDPALALVPAGMIGCDGPTLTVRVYSRVPFKDVTRLHADTDSHTSVVLARLLLRRLHGADPEVVAFDARERVEADNGRIAADEDAWPETVLLIGDKVALDPPPEARYPHTLDLGEAWKAMTDLPFVYAVWMCRADEADSPRIATAVALLDRQQRHNRTRLGWIVQTHAEARRWPRDLAARYLSELLRFEVGPREREAAEVFLAMAGEEKLLGQGRADVTPVWADPAGARAPVAG